MGDDLSVKTRPISGKTRFWMHISLTARSGSFPCCISCRVHANGKLDIVQCARVLAGTFRVETGVSLVAKFDRITFDSDVMGGRACIRGLRMTVSVVVNLVADGLSIREIIDAYPYLEPEDITQSLKYAAWLADETIHTLESTST